MKCCLSQKILFAGTKPPGGLFKSSYKKTLDLVLEYYLPEWADRSSRAHKRTARFLPRIPPTGERDCVKSPVTPWSFTINCCPFLDQHLTSLFMVSMLVLTNLEQGDH